MNGGRRVRVTGVASLEEVPRPRWDALSGTDQFYLSHDWLRFVQHEGTAETVYHLAYQGDTLLGALPGYAVRREGNPRYQLASALGVPDRYLITGARRAYVNDLLLPESRAHQDPDRDGRDGGQGPDLLGDLVGAARDRACDLGLDGCAFLYLHTPSALRLLDRWPEPQPVLLELNTELPVPGTSFDDYLGSLRKKRAALVRQERRAFAEAGYAVSIEPLSEVWPELAPLVANVQQRYGHNDTVEDCRAGLSGQAAFLGRHAIVFCARRQGQLLAGALFYHWRDTLYGRVVGFDYEALVDAGEYFNLYFYEPLEYAYRNGFRRLHLGTGSQHAKLRRGAVPRALWGVLLPTDERTAVFPDFRTRNAERLRKAKQDWKFDEVDVPKEWLDE